MTTEEWIRATHKNIAAISLIGVSSAKLQRLIDAAELGLEYAKGELAQRKESFAGYPNQWKHEERDVRGIEAALGIQEDGR